MFIRAASEYPDADHQIYKASAKHKRLLLAYVIGLAEQAGAKDPGQLARQLMLLKEGAIVTAHMLGTEGVAANSKIAARALIEKALPHPA